MEADDRRYKVPLNDVCTAAAFSLILGFVAATRWLESDGSQFPFLPAKSQRWPGCSQTFALLFDLLLTAHRCCERAHDRRRMRIGILVNVVIVESALAPSESHAVFLRCADGESVSNPMRFRLDRALTGVRAGCLDS